MDHILALDEEIGASVSKFLKKTFKSRGVNIEKGSMNPQQCLTIFEETYAHVNVELPANFTKKLQEAIKKFSSGDGSLNAEGFANVFRSTKLWELLQKKGNIKAKKAFENLAGGHAAAKDAFEQYQNDDDMLPSNQLFEAFAMLAERLKKDWADDRLMAISNRVLSARPKRMADISYQEFLQLCISGPVRSFELKPAWWTKIGKGKKKKDADAASSTAHSVGSAGGKSDDEDGDEDGEEGEAQPAKKGGTPVGKAGAAPASAAAAGVGARKGSGASVEADMRKNAAKTTESRVNDQVALLRAALLYNPACLLLEYKSGPRTIRHRKIRLYRHLAPSTNIQSLAHALHKQHGHIIDIGRLEMLLKKLQQNSSGSESPQSSSNAAGSQPNSQNVSAEITPRRTSSDNSGDIEIDPEMDYNKADDATLKAVKAKMDTEFEAKRIKPGDPGWVYDKRIEPPKKKAPSEWDDDDEF